MVREPTSSLTDFAPVHFSLRNTWKTPLSFVDAKFQGLRATRLHWQNIRLWLNTGNSLNLGGSDYGVTGTFLREVFFSFWNIWTLVETVRQEVRSLSEWWVLKDRIRENFSVVNECEFALSRRLRVKKLSKWRMHKYYKNRLQCPQDKSDPNGKVAWH